MRAQRPYQKIIRAERLGFYKGSFGWWEITLKCGHQGAVLLGDWNPHGQKVHCFYQCPEETPKETPAEAQQ